MIEPLTAAVVALVGSVIMVALGLITVICAAYRSEARITNALREDRDRLYEVELRLKRVHDDVREIAPHFARVSEYFKPRQEGK